MGILVLLISQETFFNRVHMLPYIGKYYQQDNIWNHTIFMFFSWKPSLITPTFGQLILQANELKSQIFDELFLCHI